MMSGCGGAHTYELCSKLDKLIFSFVLLLEGAFYLGWNTLHSVTCQVKAPTKQLLRINVGLLCSYHH